MIFSTYIESWDDDSQAALTASPAVNTTLFNLAFANFQKPSTSAQSTAALGGVQCASVQELADIISSIQSVGGKINLSFGGGTYPITSATGYPDSAKIVQTIADQVINPEVSSSTGTPLSFNGCDLDIEVVNSLNNPGQFFSELRSALPTQIITLTIPGQGLEVGYGSLAVAALPYVNCVNFMEYYIDLSGSNTLVEQIQQDIQSYISYGIPASQIGLGLMPDWSAANGQVLTLNNVRALTRWANTNGLYSVFIWDMNQDYEGMNGESSLAYTTAITSAMKDSKQ